MTLREYGKKLRAHDWYYDKSDDPKVFNRGFNEEVELKLIAATASTDRFQKAFDSALKKINDGYKKAPSKRITKTP